MLFVAVSFLWLPFEFSNNQIGEGRSESVGRELRASVTETLSSLMLNGSKHLVETNLPAPGYKDIEESVQFGVDMSGSIICKYFAFTGSPPPPPMTMQIKCN